MKAGGGRGQTPHPDPLPTRCDLPRRPAATARQRGECASTAGGATARRVGRGDGEVSSVSRTSRHLRLLDPRRSSLVGKGVALPPLPPRCRDRVHSLYLPACSVTTPGDPRQGCTPASLAPILDRVNPPVGSPSAVLCHGVAEAVSGPGKKLSRLSSPSRANCLQRIRRLWW